MPHCLTQGRRLASVLAVDALVRQLAIVAVRQRAYLSGVAEYPKDEIAGLATLAGLLRDEPPLTADEAGHETTANPDWSWIDV